MKKIIAVILFALMGCNSVNKLMADRNHKDDLDPVETVAQPTYQGPFVEKILIGAPGQSNLLGRGENTEYPYHSRVTLTRDIRTGPAYYAASRLADAHPTWHVTLVECAEGGVSIDAWLPGTFLYERCVSDTNAVKAATGGEIIGFFAYQGEANARGWATFSYDWATKFAGIVTSLRTSLGTSAPCIWAQLGQLGNGQSAEINTTWTLFKQNQLNVVLSNSTMIFTDDQPVVDDCHHGTIANMIIGQRFYNALANYL